MAKIAVKNGVIITENTEVLNLSDKKHFIDVEVKDFGVIKAKKVLSATYVPFGKPTFLEHKYNMYRSYVLEYKIPSNVLIEGTYQDTLNPYHYFRVDRKNGFDRLIIGGNDNMDILNIDHEIGAKIMRKYVRDFFKNDLFQEIRHWSGPISEPVSGLAYIGELSGGNIFYTFGFSGTGLTYSYIASKIFADKILNQNNPYTEIYNPDRKVSLWKSLF